MPTKKQLIAKIKRDVKLERKKAKPHVVVVARAGTGKTFTLVMAIKKMFNEMSCWDCVGQDIPSDGCELCNGTGNLKHIEGSEQQEAIWEEVWLSKKAGVTIGFAAFNRSIARVLSQRVPVRYCDTKTTHGFGMRVILRNYDLLPGDDRVDKRRTQHILANVMEVDHAELRKEQKEFMFLVCDIVGKCKQNLVGYDFDIRRFNVNNVTIAEMSKLCSRYDIDLGERRDEVFTLVPQVLEACRDLEDGCIDFNDMIWLPIVNKLDIPKYDLFLVDEAQDLNRCQQEFALQAGRRLILVGDPKQAIYGFAGADSNSMERMTNILDATGPGVVEFPLNVTYRCGHAIVEEAQKIVPDFYANEDNCEGLVAPAPGKDDRFHKKVEDGDMILCRTNLPLITQCFRFLAKGRKAVIQGRDIGQQLVNTIDRLSATDVPHLVELLQTWYDQEVIQERAKKKPSDARLISLQDRLQCLLVFCSRAIDGRVRTVINEINKVFSDNGTEGVLLSSIHRAKGLEATRIWLLMPREATIPHPLAKTAEAIEQEMNLKYVAITRAIEEFYYVQ